MNNKHFISLEDIDYQSYKSIINKAVEIKKQYKNGEVNTALANKTLAMIFDKPSTRTRVSFESGMTQLGGHAIFLSNNDSQLGRSESIEDSAKVISSMVDVVMLRISSHTNIKTFAKYSHTPVINALSDDLHPCQLLADLMAYYEHRGDIKDKTVAWIGDGNNMCNTYMQAAKLCDFKLNIATPKNYQPNQDFITKYADYINICTDAKEACNNADLIVTDVWASMGQETEKSQKEQDFLGYQVNSQLMSLAKDDAVFMHCLPAYRGKEVSAEVIDGKQSLVFAAAENRLHAQKSLLLYLLDSSL